MSFEINYTGLPKAIPVTQSLLYTYFLRPILTSRFLLFCAASLGSATAKKIQSVLKDFTLKYEQTATPKAISLIYGGDTLQKFEFLLETASKVITATKQTQVEFSAKLSLDIAIEEKKSNKEKEIAILNCANRSNVGGIWTYFNGGSQEEALFRNSDLDWHLNSEKNPKLKEQIEEKLDPTLGQHHIPYYGITFSKNVEILQPKASLNVLSAAAIDLRFWSTEKQHFDNCENRSERIKLVTMAKIDSIFAAALIEKQDILVLSAIGCGAFKNDHEMIADCFNEICKKYNGKFEKFLFSLPDEKIRKVFSETISLKKPVAVQ
jgi:uncharacterized protein (TIGR02452 family)